MDVTLLFRAEDFREYGGDCAGAIHVPSKK